MLRFLLLHNKGLDMNKENLLSLADAYAAAGFAEGGAGNHMFPFEIESKAAKRKEARAVLCAALDAADREVEILATQPDTVEGQCKYCGNINLPDKRNATFQLIRAIKAEDERDALKAENAALRAKTFNMTQAIMDAYGILWNINTDPMAPIPIVDPERAAAKARLILKEMLCHEQCGIAINAARAALGQGHE
jgi:hypothetical protein